MREARGRGRESELEWGGGWIEGGILLFKNVCIRGVECLCALSEGWGRAGVKLSWNEGGGGGGGGD